MAVQRIREEEPKMISQLPYVMIAIVALFLMALILPSRLSFSVFLFYVLCPVIIYGLFKLMVSNSEEFVNFPSLYILRTRQ